MRRRQFLGWVGTVGAAAALRPSVSLAQSASRPRIGVLAPSEPEPFRTTFLEGLKGLGYVVDENISVEFRSASGQVDKLPGLAKELVDSDINVLVAHQTPAAVAARNATTTIPIVISAGDPIGTGLVASLSKPGGNITGVSSTTGELAGKMLDLLREIVPATQRVGVLASAADPFTRPFLAQISDGAKALGIDLRAIQVSGPQDYEQAFADMVGAKVQGVIVQPSLPRRKAIDLATSHGLPSVAPAKIFATEGGLIAYSANLTDGYRALAVYVDKILKGAKPADLPMQQPTKFELAVNLKTAKALGLAIPSQLLIRADDVIE